MTIERKTMKILYVAWAPYNRRAETFASQIGAEVELIHFFKYQRPSWAPLKYPLMAVKTLTKLSSKKPDVVFAMSPPLFSALFVYLYCLISKAQFVIDAHTGSLITPPWTWFRFLHKFLSRRAIVTIVTNNYLASLVESWGAKAMIINPPISFPDVKACPLEGKINFLVVNTFSGDEPLDEVLKVAGNFPEIHFYITGDISKARHGQIETCSQNVHFTDFLPYTKYLELLKSVDGVIALTTRDHTLQSGGMEALFMGKPFITSRFPFLMNFFSKGTVYVKPEAKSIANGISEFIANHEFLQNEILKLRKERWNEWKNDLNKLMRIISNPEN